MMIALSMITVAFLGIATLLSQSFFLNRAATNETIASYLAAEGIEITKNIIDNDVYGNPLPETKLAWGDCCATGNYTVEYDSTALSLGNRGVPLKFDPTKGYQYNTGNTTPFSRMIRITLSTASEIDVQSVVTWSTGPLTNETVTDEDHFYDWHP